MRRLPFVTLTSVIVAVTFAALTLKLTQSAHELSAARMEAASVRQELTESYFGRLNQQLALVRRVRTRIGEGLPGPTSSDLETLLTASQFAAEAMQRPEIAGSDFAAGRTQLLIAMSAWAIGDWSTAERAARQAVLRLEKASGADVDGQAAVEAATAHNLLGCLLANTGHEQESLAATAAAERWTHPNRSSAELAAEMDWERALALRTRALVKASLREPAIDDAAASLQLGLRLYAARPSDRGVYRWNLPHFVLDGWQILTLLQYREGRYADAAESCRLGFAHLESIESELDRIADQRLQGARTLKRNQVRQFFQLSQQQLEQPTPRLAVWPAVERRIGRTLHPDLLSEGRMVAEFEPQSAICVAWPDEGWFHEPMTAMVAAMVNAIPVHVLVPDAEMHHEVSGRLRAAGVDPSRITLSLVPTDTVWLRDFGPVSVQAETGAPLAVDFTHGACAEGYRLLDESVPGKLALAVNRPLVVAPMMLEGGQVATNGRGICLASTRLLERNASHGLGREHVIRTLRRITGADKVVFVEPLRGEPTGHVDLFATFVAANDVVVGAYADPSDPNAALLDQHARTLEGQPTPAGPLRVHRIPMPPTQGRWAGQTYANVVFANGLLLVPRWSGVALEIESAALEVYRGLLPNWRIESLNCDAMGRRGGALHCVSLNIPAAATPPAATQQRE